MLLMRGVLFACLGVVQVLTMEWFEMGDTPGWVTFGASLGSCWVDYEDTIVVLDEGVINVMDLGLDKAHYDVHTTGGVPAPRFGGVATLKGAKMVVTGGVPSSFSVATYVDAVFPDVKVDILDLDTLVWTINVTDGWSGYTHSNRYGHTALYSHLLDAIVVYGGGYDMATTGFANMHSEVSLLDIDGETFLVASTTGPVPPPRYDHTAVLHNDKMIVFGGHDADRSVQGGRTNPSINNRRNDMFILDLALMQWVEVTGSNWPGVQSAAEAWMLPGSSLMGMVHGVTFPNGAVAMDVALFDTDDLTWTYIANEDVTDAPFIFTTQYSIVYPIGNQVIYQDGFSLAPVFVMEVSSNKGLPIAYFVDPTSELWRPWHDNKTSVAVTTPGVATMGECLYTFGGSVNYAGIAYSEPGNSLDRFCLSSRRWEWLRGPGFPERRKLLAMNSADDGQSMFMFGGKGGLILGGGTYQLSDMWRLEVTGSTPTWTLLAPDGAPNSPQDPLPLMAVDGTTVYIVHSQIAWKVHAFDTTSGTWSDLVNTTAMDPTWDATIGGINTIARATVMRNRLFVWASSFVAYFDLAARTWTIFDGHRFPDRAHFGAASVGVFLLVLGGIDAGFTYSDVLAFDTVALKWTSYVPVNAGPQISESTAAIGSVVVLVRPRTGALETELWTPTVREGASGGLSCLLRPWTGCASLEVVAGHFVNTQDTSFVEKAPTSIIVSPGTYSGATFDDTVYIFGQGFTVTGRGLHLREAGLLRNGVITACHTDGKGGGLLVTGGDQFIVENVVFEGNSAEDGGGVYLSGVPDVVMVNVSLINNTAGRLGGGMLLDVVNVQGANITVRSNTAGSRGGGIYSNHAFLDVTKATITGNEAVDGGGMFSVAFTGAVALRDSTVSANTATAGDAGDGGQGGGVGCVGIETVMLENCILSANEAQDGGAVWSDGCHVAAEGGRISGNTARRGGAAHTSACSLSLAGTAVQHNRAEEDGGAVWAEYCDVSGDLDVSLNIAAGFGGGLYLSYSPLLAEGTISGNAAAAGGGVYWALVDDLSTPVPLARRAVDVITEISSNTATFYGSDRGSLPMTLLYLSGPDAPQSSGSVITPPYRIHVLDLFGQVVTNHDTVMEVSLANVSIVAGGRQIVVDGVAEFLELRVFTLPGTYPVTFTTTSGLSLAGPPLQIRPCAPGEGLDSVGLLCRPCDAGQFSDATDGPYPCAACPPGTFANGAARTTCAQCGEGTYAEAGSAQCKPCPAGSRSNRGQAACEEVGAIEDEGGALGGVSETQVYIFIPLVLVLFCCVVLAVAMVVHRNARKTAIKQYYVDDDCTVRVGLDDEGVKKRVTELLTASSTISIGSGEFADIYKCTLEKGVYCALKVLKKEHQNNGVALAEFQSEVSALSRLMVAQHPAILDLHFYHHESPVCVVVQYCGGGTLKKRIQSPMPIPLKVKVVAQVASGIALMHKLGIAHNDIKTDNVLLDDSGDAFVADFGISSISTTDTSTVGIPMATAATIGSAPAPSLASADSPLNSVDMSSQAFSSAGLPKQGMAFTPQYVDPIRLQEGMYSADLELLQKCDVFSFATLMVAVASGKEPFHGEPTADLTARLKADPTLRCEEPEYFHAPYQQLYRDCWYQDAYMRPTSDTVFMRLAEMMEIDFGLKLEDEYSNGVLGGAE